MKLLFINKPVCCILLAACLAAVTINAQPPDVMLQKAPDVPNFHYSIMTLAAQDLAFTKFRFYSKIAYDELQFIKDGPRYHARYELSVTLFDKRGNQAEGRIVNRDIWVDQFEETNSPHIYDITSIEFKLGPAVYELLIGLMDQDSRKTGRRKTQLNIPKYLEKDLEISDILFADDIQPDSTGRLKAIPNVMGNYGKNQESMYLWFEMYTKQPVDSVLMIYRILDLKQNVLREFQEYHRAEGTRTEMVVHIPRQDLPIGKYMLQVLVGEGEPQIQVTKPLTVQWMGMPAYASDIETAIEQLKYISTGKEMKALKKAKSNEKVAHFQAFWKAKDPTPATEQNELMEEYYQRVDFSNAAFGSFSAGWRTDRGMVYIILGAPDDIERHPYEVDSKPYEIWSYYTINRQFVFLDENGFGEYRLITPFWEVLEGIR